MRKRLRRRKNRTGFTLVEMAITATIMIITSGMLIAFTQSGGNRLVLSTEQSKIGGVLNRAKSLALQRYRGNETEICGFGFLYNEPPNTYTILPVTRSEETGECLEPGDPFETFSLNPTVSFANAATGLIVFESPYLVVQNPVTMQIVLKENIETVAGIEVTSGGAIVMH